jgi:GTP-binding protein LepA
MRRLIIRLLEYELLLSKVDILLNATIVDALSSLMHTDNAYSIGKKMCEKLKKLIPRTI